jgi:hypothetical protein
LTVDNTLDGTALERLGALMLVGFEKMGCTPMQVVHLPRFMANAGFINMEKKAVHCDYRTVGKARESGAA